MVSRERSCDFFLTLSQPLLRLGFVKDLAQVLLAFSRFILAFSPSSLSYSPPIGLPPCHSLPQFRSHSHWFASLCLSTPPPVIGALSLSKPQLRWTTPWAPNPRSIVAAHPQGETFQLVVNLKPPILPPPEPPPIGFRLNPLSTNELLVTDCVLRRRPPKPPWLNWAWFKLASMVFVNMSQQRFVLLVKKGLTEPLGVVNTNTCMQPLPVSPFFQPGVQF
ncbi:hypothetical protein P8452_26065 [Trifolium repens]|nr:hypothetical protein P8452_26065 [Trifolium repens]